MFGRNEAKEVFDEEIKGYKEKLENSVPKADYDALKDEFESTKSTIAELQTKLQSVQSPPPPSPEPVDPTTEMITDPAGFISKQTAGTAMMALQSRADLLEMRARQKYSAIFAEHEKELIDSASKFSINQRADNAFWDVHVERIVGGKLLRGEFKGSYPSLMGSGSSSTGSGSVEYTSNLESWEVEYAKKRGIPIEKAEAMKKVIKSGDKISLENARA